MSAVETFHTKWQTKEYQCRVATCFAQVLCYDMYSVYSFKLRLCVAKDSVEMTMVTVIRFLNLEDFSVSETLCM